VTKLLAFELIDSKTRGAGHSVMRSSLFLSDTDSAIMSEGRIGGKPARERKSERFTKVRSHGFGDLQFSKSVPPTFRLTVS
jgi:hypothetical protein